MIPPCCNLHYCTISKHVLQHPSYVLTVIKPKMVTSQQWHLKFLHHCHHSCGLSSITKQKKLCFVCNYNLEKKINMKNLVLARKLFSVNCLMRLQNFIILSICKKERQVLNRKRKEDAIVYIHPPFSNSSI